MHLRERVEQVLKQGAGSNITLGYRYAVDDVEGNVVRVGALPRVDIADYRGRNVFTDHPYDNSGLRSCELLLAEDGFLIEWIQDRAGDYLLVREAKD